MDPIQQPLRKGNEFLSGLNDVYDAPIRPPTREAEPGEREWAEPPENSHNATSYHCLVSPPSDAGRHLAACQLG